MKAVIIGCTGLVGKEILKCCDEGSFDTIEAISRRPVNRSSDKIHNLIETDAGKWGEIIKEEGKGANVFFSAFGTTRAAAGGIEQFKEIDYGVNYKSALAAKELGIETYVLISSIGASSGSMFPYLSSKGKLEDDVLALEFPRTIILRPGILLGQREKPKDIMNRIGLGLGCITYNRFLRSLAYPIYGDEVAKVAVSLANKPISTTKEVQIIEKADLYALKDEI